MSKLDRAIRVHQELQDLLLGMEAGSNTALSGLLSQLTGEIIRMVGASTNATGKAVPSEAEVTRIIQTIVRELQAMTPDVVAEHARLFEAVNDAVYGKGVESYAAFNRTTADRMRAAWQAFDASGARAGTYRAGRDAWLAEFERTKAELLTRVRGHMLRGQLAGDGQRELARRIAQDPLFRMENLPGLGPDGRLPKATERMFTMGGRLGPNAALEGRAARIVRESVSVATNDLHERWTQEAFGEEVKYVNINPLDSRTTPVCLDASRRRGMTRSEWDAALGWAPRHFGCRSTMFALPPGTPATETGEPRGVTITERETEKGKRLVLQES